MQIRKISREEHLAYINKRDSVSFLQTPAWGDIKQGWTAQSLGWYNDDQLVGAGLVLFRKVPKVNKFLAYLPEGPDIAWALDGANALDALVAYLRTQNVFQIKIGPQVWNRRWNSDTIKEAIAAGTAKRIGDLPADSTNPIGQKLISVLRERGWKQPPASDAGFGDYQPRFVFQVGLAGKTREHLLTEFNQLWRRNIKKADKEGVVVALGDRDALPQFHECYVETAVRDHFTARPLSYFEHMWDHMKAEAPERISLYLATHPDHQGAIAATTLTRVGNHAWYSYGASTTAARDLRPSNAVQWRMMCDALDAGCSVYDMRGISETLDPNNHLFGLIQFKVGTGGYVQEYVGEWDYVLSPLWATAFALYMRRR